MLGPIKRSEPINKIDAKEDTINHYKSKKTDDTFHDTYISYKSKGDENTSIEQYFEKTEPYLDDMIDKF